MNLGNTLKDLRIDTDLGWNHHIWFMWLGNSTRCRHLNLCWDCHSAWTGSPFLNQPVFAMFGNILVRVNIPNGSSSSTRWSRGQKSINPLYVAKKHSSQHFLCSFCSLDIFSAHLSFHLLSSSQLSSFSLLPSLAHVFLRFPSSSLLLFAAFLNSVRVSSSQLFGGSSPCCLFRLFSKYEFFYTSLVELFLAHTTKVSPKLPNVSI